MPWQITASSRRNALRQTVSAAAAVDNVVNNQVAVHDGQDVRRRRTHSVAAAAWVRRAGRGQRRGILRCRLAVSAATNSTRQLRLRQVSLSTETRRRSVLQYSVSTVRHQAAVVLTPRPHTLPTPSLPTAVPASYHCYQCGYKFGTKSRDKWRSAHTQRKMSQNN